MFENFTDRARRVISYAIKLAQQVGADYVDTEHLLLGLHQEPTGLAAHALRECGAEETSIQDVLRLVVIASPSESAPLPFAPQAKCALEESIAQARRFGHPYIGTEHILLGLLKDPKSAVARVLKTLKVAPQAIVVVLYDLLGFDPSAYPEAKKVEEKTTGTATCERCNGAGIVRQKAGSVTVQISCPLCWGSGKSDVKPKPVTMEEVGMLSDFPVNQATAIINGMLKRALHSADVDEETAKRVMDALVDALLQGSYFTLAYFMYQGGGPHGRGYKVKPEPLTPERIAHMNDFVRSKRELAPHEQNEIYARLKKLLERQ